MSARAAVALPGPVAALLDGRDLDLKVGHTITLAAADSAGWPRMALLSVGEVLTTTGADLRLALHPRSGTTAALTQSGKALLGLVNDGMWYRIRAEVERVDAPGADSLAYFYGQISQVDEDQVGYATITNGLTFEVTDRERVVARWREQLERLKRWDRERSPGARSAAAPYRRHYRRERRDTRRSAAGADS